MASAEVVEFRRFLRSAFCARRFNMPRVRQVTRRRSARVFPLLAKEGWPRHQENDSLPKSARTGWSITSQLVVWLTTPSAALRRLRVFFASLLFMQQPPLLCKEG